eukprot:CAMPEP_0184483912 /NCGR_PEP_ID=MMETSP0113_2-20130426/5592_1 /TAXON_ID=91329 /ORGANISM="Norrisiella sphaerica, Strain BC52" /LENGTH=429 /DNA_ID=CAMNT_0026864585 /DNA_START=39 /DNA_END=1328 /DNA_ORIENTATION=-
MDSEEEISPKAQFKLPNVHESLSHYLQNFNLIKRQKEEKDIKDTPRTARLLGKFQTAHMMLETVEPSTGNHSKQENAKEKTKEIATDADYDEDEKTGKSLPNLDAYSMRFSPDSQELAVALSDGTIRIIDPDKRKQLKVLNNTKQQNPCTCIRYRPTLGGSVKTRNVLIAAIGDGRIQHWHVPSNKKIFEIAEKGNEILALDYSSNSEFFASGGTDKIVRVYEEQTKSLLVELKMGIGSRDSDGHSQRIYAVKFHPRDPNMIISSGWDDTVHVWDIRAGCSVKMWDGPHVCGDSLDVYEDIVLTGSWRERDGLQVWDLSNGKLVKTIDFHYKDKKDKLTDHIYGAQFSMDGDLIAAGGSFTPEARIFNVRRNFKRLDRMWTRGKGIYSLAFSNSGRMLAAGSQGGSLSIMDMMPQMTDEFKGSERAEEY